MIIDKIKTLILGILNVIPLQLLAYHIAKNRGLSVDAQGNEREEHSLETDSSLNSPEKWRVDWKLQIVS